MVLVWPSGRCERLGRALGRPGLSAGLPCVVLVWPSELMVAKVIRGKQRHEGLKFPSLHSRIANAQELLVVVAARHNQPSNYLSKSSLERLLVNYSTAMTCLQSFPWLPRDYFYHGSWALRLRKESWDHHSNAVLPIHDQVDSCLCPNSTPQLSVHIGTDKHQLC